MDSTITPSQKSELRHTARWVSPLNNCFLLDFTVGAEISSLTDMVSIFSNSSSESLGGSIVQWEKMRDITFRMVKMSLSSKL